MVNGVDDLLALWGPDRVLHLFEVAQTATPERNSTQAQLLVELAVNAELFHTPDGDAYASIVVGEHIETWQIKGRKFRLWLQGRFYREHHKPPGTQALQEAIGVLEAQALHDAGELPVFVRIAGQSGHIYIDLCDANWRVIDVSIDGWRVVDQAPVRFRRHKGMMALPTPVHGGLIGNLRDLINIGSEANWTLCLAWLVAAFHPEGPYPLLILQGEHGSAKSTTAKILRMLVDPSTALVRTPPSDERDLVITAKNSWILAFDNVSGIQPWLSDGFCRLATGGGLATRELYTDADEVLFDAKRPVVLNGIDQLAGRPDLGDRSLILNLPQIDTVERREEKRLYAEFESKQAQLLGAVLDAVSTALRRYSDVHLNSLPRMADFAVWATAAEPGLGLAPGSFIKAYTGNREEAIDAALDSDSVALALANLLVTSGPWQGTAGDLLHALEPHAIEQVRRSHEWPKNPRALSSRLKRLAPFLREQGTVVTFQPRSTNGCRPINIQRMARQNAVNTVTTVTTVTNTRLTSKVEHDTGQGSGGHSGTVTKAVRQHNEPPPQNNGANQLSGRIPSAPDGGSGGSGDPKPEESSTVEEGWI